MGEERIQVISYSGYRGEETPRALFLHDKKIEVLEILSRCVAEPLGNRTRKRLFKVKGNDGAIYEISYDEKTMEWFYRPKG